MAEEVKEPIVDYFPQGNLYTYADYLVSNIKERFEVMRGQIVKMSPSPSKTHQKVLLNLTLIIGTKFKSHQCQVFLAPFDVRLIDPKKNSTKNEDIITVLQPDLCVVCDEDKLDERGCVGGPDLVIEILSPGNSKKELDKKFRLYEENKVREYWMVDSSEKVIWQYILERDRLIGLKPITVDEVITSHIFPDLSFPASEVFEF